MVWAWLDLTNASEAGLRKLVKFNCAKDSKIVPFIERGYGDADELDLESHLSVGR